MRYSECLFVLFVMKMKRNWKQIVVIGFGYQITDSFIDRVVRIKEINHLPAPYFLFENSPNFQRAIFVFWNLLPPYFFVQKHFQIFLVDFRQFFWNYRNMLFIEFLWFLAHLENPGRNSSWKLVMNISEIHRWKSTKLHYSQ